jgi:aryl-alcohol dehydrogenase-like predicted oxidoreductase
MGNEPGLKIGLGTAQFGLDYGISNRSGKVSRDEAARILALAEAAGIRLLDTATAYGESEQLLGDLLPEDHPFAIVTKLPRLPAGMTPSGAGGWVREAVAQSLDRLRSSNLYGLLIHSAQDLLEPAGASVWQAMNELRRARVVDKIGASVYTASDIDGLLARYPLQLVQLPLNVFDQRLIRSGHLERLKVARVEIHARSVLLQGLLLMDPADLPDPHFDAARTALRAFHLAARDAGKTPLQAAVAYAMSLDQVDVAMFGVTDETQLAEILGAAQPSLPRDWFTAFALDDQTILNPALWPA